MLPMYDVHRDGPYLRVVLPQVLPPDWAGLRRELFSELLDGGVDRVTIVTPRFAHDRDDRAALDQLVSGLSDLEVQTCVEWRGWQLVIV